MHFPRVLRPTDGMTSQAEVETRLLGLFAGISWNNRSDYCLESKESDLATGCSENESICECVMPLGDIYGILIGTYFMYMIVAVYLDVVIPDESGSQPPWFFLLPKCDLQFLYLFVTSVSTLPD